MKILKEGRIPIPPKAWWITIVMTCDHCKAEFQLEETDKPTVWMPRFIGARPTVEYPCPTCRKNVIKLKP